MLEAASGANEPNPFLEDEEAIMLDPIRRERRVTSGLSKQRPPSSTRASTYIGHR